MKAKSSKPATKQKQAAVKLKDLKPKKSPKGGMISTDPEEEGGVLLP